MRALVVLLGVLAALPLAPWGAPSQATGVDSSRSLARAAAAPGLLERLDDALMLMRGAQRRQGRMSRRQGPPPAAAEALLDDAAAAAAARNMPCMAPAAFVDTLHCFTQAAPRAPLCCCTVAGLPEAHCMPAFIVVGAQKSGSTALFANMLQHPLFKAPARKEAHFFDRAVKRRGEMRARIVKYIKQMPALSPSQARMGMLTGECTPSYMLQPQAMRRIRAWLPNVRLVVILRNPVDRAFSEYQMKLRRVDRQFDPASHPRDAAILATVLDRCLEDELPGERARLYDRLLRQDALEKPPAVFTGEDKDDPTISMPALGSIDEICLWDNLVRIDGFIERVRFPARAVALVKCLADSVGDVIASQSDTRGHSCFSTIKRESVPPLEKVFPEEMSAVAECMVPKQDAVSCSHTSTNAKFRWGEPECWPQGSTSNIQHDFIPRGVFSEQLDSIYEHFPRDRVLVLGDHELRSDPQGTLARVFAHVGLPPSNVDALSEPALDSLISKQWANFGPRNGWQLHGNYSAMDARLRAQLQRFYAPHNTRLFRNLGIAPYPGWDVCDNQDGDGNEHDL